MVCLISALAKEQLEEYESLIKVYKNVLVCKKCNKLYGSDLSLKEENEICPICEKK